MCWRWKAACRRDWTDGSSLPPSRKPSVHPSPGTELLLAFTVCVTHQQKVISDKLSTRSHLLSWTCHNSVYANEEKRRRRDLQPSLGPFRAPSVWVWLHRGNMNLHMESVGRVHWVEWTRRDTLIIGARSHFLFLQTADLAVIVLNFLHCCSWVDVLAQIYPPPP